MPVPPISKRLFGHLPDGREVHAWTLPGKDGFAVEILDWGALVHRIMVPDQAGELVDVALGYDTLDGYLDNPAYFGAMVGRVAGRIPQAQFELDGKIYRLAANDGPNHLHGGLGGFHRKLWQAETGVDVAELRMRLESPDGEDGYPGNASVAVRYSIEGKSTLRIDWSVAVDQSCPVALTNHTYFNLAGQGNGDIQDHGFRIHAREFAPMDAQMAPDGRRLGVTHPGNDLRQARLAGEFLGQIHRQHGDYYFLEGPFDGSLARAAEVFHPGSGRKLTVLTDEPGLQFYSGVSLPLAGPGKGSKAYPAFGGFCLECQGCAASAIYPNLGSIMVRPDQPIRRTTLFAFNSPNHSHD